MIASGDGVAWARIAGMATDAAGLARFSYRPATNLWCRVVFAGAPDAVARSSAPTRVLVRQIALLRPATGGTAKTMPAGTTVTFRTTIRPVRLGPPAATATYRVYRWSGSTWTLALEQRVDASREGIAQLSWSFGRVGRWYVVSQADPTPDNANSAWSEAQRYEVH
jgi:hypothetical protein